MAQSDQKNDDSGVSQERRDAKKVLQVLIPSLPGPTIDYITQSVFAKRGASAGALSSVSLQQPAQQDVRRFKLKKMDSGEFGQYSASLFSPTKKSKGTNVFGIANLLHFDFKSSVTQ